jgi:hypothetical protein
MKNVGTNADVAALKGRSTFSSGVSDLLRLRNSAELVAQALQKLALSDVRIASLVVVFRGLIGSQKRMKQFICPGLSTARPLALAALSNLALYRDGF